ncbi:N-6 DNA methylase [Paeniglutamicibacter gangotriensis]|uniref:site-specific DNA-methyltransferase (adenine-specific) n=1 Tax=Paeniglutamicibacter gangotriensis TaxID=254787 RepID=A0A5B0EIR8_9MICC|nr:Eco57I restriction-modification methylase domain-containing protein [Paeniglutamicibacter gangotriensis]KAA0977179.1 N-6 DNA methylase [Paeniglutamicibacter gangotriensis]
MNSHDLLETVERRRQSTLQSLDPATQVSLGQYFTPHAAATLIASMPTLPMSGSLKILDPGAGTGSLAASMVARILAESPELHVHLVALEIDEQVAVHLRQTMADLEATVAGTSLVLTTEVLVDDFVDPHGQLDDDFDLVIMNPPYAKLPAASRHRAAMAQLGVQTPNIYAAFLARATLMLKQGGQVVAITPRSFTNGVYFEPFRQFFLDRMAIDHIHVFDSRSTVFSDTGVLQENIIFNAVRGGFVDQVELTASIGHEDEVRLKSVAYGDIVRPTDARNFIRIPVGDEDDAIVAMMLDLPTTLHDLGVTVSTGRVVDFRSRENLIPGVTAGFPMVYPANIKHGLVEHPKDNAKPQWFNFVEESDHKWLVPSGTYVLIKRFSSKEEHRRIVAGIWSNTSNPDCPVAFDNKLNYIHCSGEGLDAELAAGLSIWLNSGPVDKYFRTFSGHTQVNATDLREMRYPTAAELRYLGYGHNGELPSQEAIDQSVMSILGWKEVAA